ncbi:MAG: ABC transporter ATP-binding protein [Eubacteriales bacterium]
MKPYMKYIKPYLIFFILSPLLMIIEVYCDVKIPSLSAEIINVGVVNGDTSHILSLTAQMIGFVCLAVASGVGAAYFATKAAANFACDLRGDVFLKIQSFSFANIDKFHTGSLITRLTNDITQLQQLVVMCLRMLFRAPGMLIGAMIMAYVISPKLSVVFFVLLPVLAVTIYIVLAISYKKFGVLQDKVDSLNTNIQEVLTNIRVIKAFTREGHEYEKFQGVNDNLKEAGLKAYRISILQMPIMTVAVNFACIAIIWIGSQAFDTGDLLLGDISALITYLTQILMSVNMIAMIFLQSSRAIISGMRISEVLDAKVTIVSECSGTEHKIVESGTIVFDHVNFSYYDNNVDLVLADVNFTIQSGETIGVVGSTGCGKTSLIHLIPRLYDVNGGAIYVDGMNVKEYDLTNLRDGVSVVLQNNTLFSGTIRENIAWGNPNATLEEVQEVAKWAAADGFISEKSKGYDSIVEQGGRNLSGGQKQRLCIARALLKKPKILILDDSTSAVDMATEREIIHCFNTRLQDTTKIIIAQRISSVEHADRIIVMNDGQIEAIGTHRELLEKSETYQEICSLSMQTEVS